MDLLRTPKVVAVGLLRTPKAEVEQVVAAQVCGRMVEVAVDPVCGAKVGAAVAHSSAVARAVEMPLSSVVVVKVLSFAHGQTSVAARTCACVPASMLGSGGVATVIVIGIADHASACSSAGAAAAGVTDTIGAGA